MIAISLWQPFAQLVADRRKPHETRHWPIPSRLLGEECAIHASRRLQPYERELAKGWGFDPGTLPLGKIVAVVKLSSCMRTDMFFEAPYDLEYGNFDPGRYAWRLENVRKLRNPVECLGHQGFFHLPADVEGQVLEELAGRLRNPRPGDRLSESELAALMRSPR